MHHLTDRIIHTTAFVTPVVEHWSEPNKCSTTGVTKAVVCYPVCGMMHIKEPLLLIRKSSPCSGCSGFPFSLSGPLSYVRRHININKMWDDAYKRTLAANRKE